MRRLFYLLYDMENVNEQSRRDEMKDEDEMNRDRDQ